MDETRFEFAVTYVLNNGKEVLGTVGATDAAQAVRAVEESLASPTPMIFIRLNNDKFTAVRKASVDQYTVELVYEYTRTPGMERQKGGPKVWVGE